MKVYGFIAVVFLISCASKMALKEEYKDLGKVSWVVTKDIELDDHYQFLPDDKKHEFSGCMTKSCESSSFAQLRKGCHLTYTKIAAETKKFGRPKIQEGFKGNGELFYRVNDRRVPASFKGGELSYESLEYRLNLDDSHQVICYFDRNQEKDHPNLEVFHKAVSKFMRTVK